MTQTFFRSMLPQSPWTPPVVSELPSWRGAKRVGIDVETRDDDLKELGPGVRRGAYVVGVSFAIEDDDRREGYYLPIAHEGGGNLDPARVWQYLRDQAEVFTGTVVGANLGYDLDFLWEQSVVFDKAKRHVCVQTTDVLCDEWQDSYKLDDVAKRWGFEGKDETLLNEAAAWHGIKKKDVKRLLWKLHAKYVGPYAERDARLPLQVLRKQERQLDAEDLIHAWALECDVLPVLVKMRRRGVKVNLQKTRAIEAWARQAAAEKCAEVTHLTGIGFAVTDLWKPEAVELVLNHVGYQRPRMPGGAVHYLYTGVDKVVIDDCKHPAAKAIKRGREIAKLVEYCERIYKHAPNGRMHPTYHQLRSDDDRTDDAGSKRKGKRGKGTRHGRMSATHDNIQQQPGRDDDFGDRWRAIYEAEDDCDWVSGDVSQQEPRLVVDLAEQCRLPGAREAAQRYRDDPATDHHTMVAQITSIDRKPAKNLGNGLNYWMGEAKLARTLGLPTAWEEDSRTGEWREVAGPEAKAMIAQFHDRLPFVRGLLYKCKEVADQRGYVLGHRRRRCRFRLKGPQDRDYGRGSIYAETYKALNMVIQPRAAGQMKEILVAADRAGIPQQLTVHDEVDFSEPKSQNFRQARELREIMLTVVTIGLPWKVDLEVGPSWGELQKIEKARPDLF